MELELASFLRSKTNMHIFNLEKMWALMQQRTAQIFFCWIRDFGLTSRILICFCTTSTACKIGKEIHKIELCKLAVLWNRRFNFILSWLEWWFHTFISVIRLHRQKQKQSWGVQYKSMTLLGEFLIRTQQGLLLYYVSYWLAGTVVHFMLESCLCQNQYFLYMLFGNIFVKSKKKYVLWVVFIKVVVVC